MRCCETFHHSTAFAHRRVLVCRAAPRLPVLRFCALRKAHAPRWDSWRDSWRDSWQGGAQVEYERIKEAYSSMVHSLEAAASEKRVMEQRLSQVQADAGREGRARRCPASPLPQRPALAHSRQISTLKRMSAVDQVTSSSDGLLSLREGAKLKLGQIPEHSTTRDHCSRAG